MKEKLPPIDLKERAVLTPGALIKNLPDKHKNWKCNSGLLLSFSFLEPGLLRWLKRQGAVISGSHRFCSSIWTIRAKNKNVTVAFMNGIGAPLAAALLEELVFLGARRVVLLGVCGVLDSEITRRTIIVPNKAYCDEGISVHYVKGPISARAHKGLVSCLKKHLVNSGHPFREGSNWTTDALYRETPSRIKEFRKMGVISVDMETSALFSVARFHEAPAAALLQAVDSVENKWSYRKEQKKKGPDVEKVAEIGIIALGDFK